MFKNYFILVSTEPNTDTPTFWDISEMAWTHEAEQATRFDNRILCAPLPEGIGLVIECDPNGNYINSYAPLDLPHLDIPAWVS